MLLSQAQLSYQNKCGFYPQKRQSNRRLLSQLDEFDQDIIIGNTANERQENTIVNEKAGDWDFTFGTFGNNLMTNENTVNAKTLERCFNERIDREVSKIVDTVENRIENAILTAIDSIIAPKIELAISSINASTGRDATRVTANSERGDILGLLPLLKTHLKTVMYYSYQIRMMRLKTVFRTR